MPMMQHNFFDPMGHESIQAIYKKQRKTLEDQLLQVKKPKEKEADVSDFSQLHPNNHHKKMPCPFITFIISFLFCTFMFSEWYPWTALVIKISIPYMFKNDNSMWGMITELQKYKNNI